MPDIRIAIASDLHLEIRRRHLLRDGLDETAADAAMAELRQSARQSAADADLVIVAGDVAAGIDGLQWAAATFDPLPVIYVAGNHEFYDHERAHLVKLLRDAARGSGNVRFMEQDESEFSLRGRPVRILGCTAWTDYRLYGEALAGEAMRRAEAQMYDHRRIASGGRPFSADDARQLHRTARDWLAARLVQPGDVTTIVVTHHAPHAQSIEPRFAGDSLSAAFASDMAPLMHEYGPALWVHGHTHYNVDYTIGRTRVVSHQWGYPRENLSRVCRVVEI
jgi:predicted phosphodiesterase